jgi:hypothetical protein
MNGIEDRSCFFVGSVCYKDRDNQKVFNTVSGRCEISTQIQGELPPTAWSPLWQIVIPSWSEGKSFAEIGESGMRNREQTKSSKSDIDQLVEYLQSV